MLMKPELARLVLSGRKTQTRRLVKPTVPQLADDATAEQEQRHAKTYCYYRVGRQHPYPLERLARRDEMSELDKARMDRPDPRRRGRPPRVVIGHLDIVDVREERAGDISFADARAEGFRTRTDFVRYWLALHDRAWPAIDQAPCPACLGDPEHPSDELPPCEQCGGSGWRDFRPEPTDDEVLDRFAARHVDRRVWVITFELNRDHEPRYLAERSELGYVASEYNERGRRIALVGEAEALSESEHELHVAKPARERDVARRDQQRRDRELLDIEERMRIARAQARLKHVDLRDEIRLYRQQREDGKPREAVIKTLERAERRVFPEAA